MSSAFEAPILCVINIHCCIIFALLFALNLYFQRRVNARLIKETCFASSTAFLGFGATAVQESQNFVANHPFFFMIIQRPALKPFSGITESFLNGFCFFYGKLEVF